MGNIINKFALVTYFQNESHWLNLHLPYLAPHFDMIIAVDGGSGDGSRYVVERHGGIVYDRPFDNDHSAQMNFALDRAAEHGVTHILRLDPDEVMFGDAIDSIKRLMTFYDMVWLPRYTFEEDRRHYWADVYPDWQPRAHRVDIRWTGKVHESPMPDVKARGLAFFKAYGSPIYHYEGIYSGQYKAMKYWNYRRMVTGQPLLTRYDTPAEHRPHIPFTGDQPIETEKKRAPLPDVDVTPYELRGTRIWVRTDTDRAVLHEVQDTYLWERLPAQVARIIDIGGHIGCFTIEAKRRYPKSRVSIVEIEQQNFELLQFHLGHWTDVDLHLARCGYEEGDFELAYNHMSTSSHRVVRRGTFEHDHFRPQAITVPLVSLEQLTPDNEPVDVLKLDVEGSEIDILCGVSEEWLSRVQCIVGEYHMPVFVFQSTAGKRLSRLFNVEYFPTREALGMFICHRK
jgi:FkbM family methyltransferase